MSVSTIMLEIPQLFTPYLKVEGQIVEVELEACLEKTEDFEFIKNPDIINGLQNYRVELRTHIDISKSKFVRYFHAYLSNYYTRINKGRGFYSKTILQFMPSGVFYQMLYIQDTGILKLDIIW